MHDRVCRRTRRPIVVMAAAAVFMLSASAFAGTPRLGVGCGTGASIVGSDTGGKVTLGSGSGVCTLIFSGTYTNAPACTAMNETNGGAQAVAAGVKTTTTQLTVAVPWADGDTIAYLCTMY